MQAESPGESRGLAPWMPAVVPRVRASLALRQAPPADRRASRRRDCQVARPNGAHSFDRPRPQAQPQAGGVHIDDLLVIDPHQQAARRQSAAGSCTSWLSSKCMSSALWFSEASRSLMLEIPTIDPPQPPTIRVTHSSVERVGTVRPQKKSEPSVRCASSSTSNGASGTGPVQRAPARPSYHGSRNTPSSPSHPLPSPATISHLASPAGLHSIQPSGSAGTGCASGRLGCRSPHRLARPAPDLRRPTPGHQRHHQPGRHPCEYSGSAHRRRA